MAYSLADIFGASASISGDVLSIDLTELSDFDDVALIAADVSANPELAIVGLANLWQSNALNDGDNVTDLTKGFLIDERSTGTSRVRGTTQQAQVTQTLRFYFLFNQSFGKANLV